MAGLENQTVILPKPTIMNTASQVATPKPVETAPVVAVETPKPTEAKVEAPTVTSADILKRVSNPKPEAPVVQAPEEIQTQAELDKITDPAQKAIIEKKIKDLESGYNKKYQTLAQQRKEVEDLKFKMSNWTPQRLAEELRKPEFVQAMQALQQTAPPSNFEGNPEEWSNLSDSEKRQFSEMKKSQDMLQAQLAHMKQKEEDIEIKKLYPDFEPQIVDEAIEGLRTGSLTASRADIWKVVNHDKNVEKGYTVGYEDGYQKALEKLNGSTPLNGNLNITPSNEIPDEIRKQGFMAMYNYRKQSKNGSSQTKR